MENWGIRTVKEVFGFVYNDACSSILWKDIGHEKPNTCYLMPVRFFTGSPLEFSKVKANHEANLRTKSNNKAGRRYADLGQRFVHPC